MEVIFEMIHDGEARIPWRVCTSDGDLLESGATACNAVRAAHDAMQRHIEEERAELADEH